MPSRPTSTTETGLSSVQRGKLTKMRPSAETATPVAWLGKCAASSSRNGPGLEEEGGGEAGAKACDWARARPAASVARAKLPASTYRRWPLRFSPGKLRHPKQRG